MVQITSARLPSLAAFRYRAGGSTNLRLIGAFPLFIDRYDTIQRILGVGIGQYPSVFGVTAYSNVFVTTILNSGIVGLIILILYIVYLFNNIQRERRIYLILLVMVWACDFQWANWYVFYIMSAFTLVSKKEGEIACAK